MLAFVLRRILQSAMVMAVVAFIAFGLFNFTGDPVAFMLGQDATIQDRERLRADLGLDRPFYVQFGRFLDNAVHGEFGISLRQGRKVSTLLKERLPGHARALASPRRCSRCASAFRSACTRRCDETPGAPTCCSRRR